MRERICYLCGRPAAGYASVWTAAEGERWYCHGDEDEVSCYERQSWSESGIDEPLEPFASILADHEKRRAGATDRWARLAAMPVTGDTVTYEIATDPMEDR